MTTIMPDSELLRRAVKWISENLKEDENQSVKKLINEATLRFDLNPMQANYLYNFYLQK